MKNTKIEWAHHTFNPWIGCTKISSACDNCYAEKSMPAKMLGVQWGAHAERRRTSVANWKQPLRWNAEAEKLGVRYRVFCASLADVFDNAVPSSWRADLFDLIEKTPNLDWLLLTKRIGNAAEMMTQVGRELFWMDHLNQVRVLPNVWLGATICNQDEANRDIPKLLAVPAAKRFLSIEPLLGSVDLSTHRGAKGLPIYWEGTNEDGLMPIHCQLTGRHLGDFHRRGWVKTSENMSPFIDWVIVGGESGHNARPMHPDWVRSLRDQCTAACVPFFFKQHGEWLATEFCDDDMAMIPSKQTVYVGKDGSFHDGTDGVDFFGGDQEAAWVGKKAAGRMLDGREWSEVPA